jgi:hypothetical protein
MSVMGATAAFAAPLVKSIVVPTAAQAQASCVEQGGQCGINDGEGCNTQTFPPCCPAPGIACRALPEQQCFCTTGTA